MVDSLSQAARSENMRRIKAKHTSPERIVRSLLHAKGYRFRLHRRDLPGKPDIVFAGRKKVVFVHGCFWHQHASLECRSGRKPKSNLDYWGAKLERNVERDAQHERELLASGWAVLTVWECELRNKVTLMAKLESFLR